MFFSSAKMEDYVKKEDDVELASVRSAPTLHEAPSSVDEKSPPSPPLDMNRGFSVEPVFVKSAAMGISPPIPAVKVTKPDMSFGIFPLPRIELGLIWYRTEELSLLDIELIEGGWKTAKALFQRLVNYPDEYLTQILQVLRNQLYLNNTILRWNIWWHACRTTNDMLYAIAACTECNVPRFLSMRTLYSLDPQIKLLAITCTDIGLVCHHQSDEKKMLLRRPKSGTESGSNNASRTTEDESQNLQLVPYAPRPSQRTQTDDFVTWAQVAPTTVQGMLHDPQQYFDPYDATQAAPEHFISSYPMIQFRARDPISEEAKYFRRYQATSLWRETFRDFTKWSDIHKEAQYDGEEDISAVFRWSTAMRSRFLS